MYAAEMNALVIGKRIGFIKKYRYAGEDREKTVDIWVVKITHRKSNTIIWGKDKERTADRNAVCQTIPFDTEWSYLD